MKPKPTKEGIGAKFETQARARKLNEDPSAKEIHYMLDAKENIPLQVFNRANAS